MAVPALARARGNYLRMRGEESYSARLPVQNEELPPHARRRVKYCSRFLLPAGITSACAEKRCIVWPSALMHRNYLRMRGEEEFFTLVTSALGELPPHARRRETGLHPG